MIKNVSFAGKAYFLGDISKTMTPEQKKRIEVYAQKQSEDTDVVVIGQETDTIFEYQGKKYDSFAISLNLDDDICYDIKTEQGKKTVPISEVKTTEIPLSVWNAYIFHGYNKGDIKLIPERKQFDFTDGAKSTIIMPNGRRDKDISF